MHYATPLDDLIGQTFYIDGALWRYLYNENLRRFALRRTVSRLPLDRAVELIASGEVLWTPPDRVEPLAADLSTETVQERIALMEAFRKSPAGVDSTDWTTRAVIEEQLTLFRNWLARRTLTSGGMTDNIVGDNTLDETQ
jgi:hypothetical protein